MAGRLREQVLARGERLEACCWQPESSRLWALLRLDADSLELQVRRADDLSVARRLELRDPFVDTSFAMHIHSEGELVLLEGAAGQDGNCGLWCWDDGSRLHIAHQADRGGALVLHPSGAEMLSLEVDVSRILRLSFPGLELLGTLEQPESWEDDSFDYTACYVSDQRAVIATAEGLLFTLELEAMRLGEPIILEGHEPRPCREWYPRLNGEHHLCSDLRYIDAVSGEQIISIHSILPAPPDADPADFVALRWGGPELFGPLSSPDATRPLTRAFIEKWIAPL